MIGRDSSILSECNYNIRSFHCGRRGDLSVRHEMQGGKSLVTGRAVPKFPAFV